MGHHTTRSSIRFAGAAVLVAAGACGRSSHPTDASLRQTFSNHRAEFTELREMAAVDSQYTRIAPSWLRKGPGQNVSTDSLPAGRIERYRELFAAVHSDLGVWQMKDECAFPISSMGIVSHGSSKGLAYRSTPPKTQVGSLEDVTGKGVWYVPIGDGWYVYLDRD
jgi:hypothetical protein